MDSKWPARVAGGAAGLANGLFGGGGGMVFLPILSRWGSLEQRKLYATCVAVIFPVCLVSAAVHLWRGSVSLSAAWPYLAGGLIGGNIMCKLSGKKVNPLIGSAGVSAVPMAARVSQMVGQKANPANFLLMHAMGPNVAGVIGSAVAAGVFISMFG